MHHKHTGYDLASHHQILCCVYNVFVFVNRALQQWLGLELLDLFDLWHIIRIYLLLHLVSL